MNQPIRNVVFDLGGVVVDLAMEEVRRAYCELGMPRMAKLMDPCYPAEMNERLERGDIDFHEACDAMRRIDNRPEVTDKQIATVYDRFLNRVDPAKIETIERLRAAGLRTYVLSNTNPVAFAIVQRRFAEHGRSTEACFDGIYLSYRLRMLKPAPAIFERLVAESGIAPAETLFIDDGSRNVGTAASLGFQVFCPPTNGSFLEAVGPLLQK